LENNVNICYTDVGGHWQLTTIHTVILLDVIINKRCAKRQ